MVNNPMGLQYNNYKIKRMCMSVSLLNTPADNKTREMWFCGNMTYNTRTYRFIRMRQGLPEALVGRALENSAPLDDSEYLQALPGQPTTK